MGQQILRGRAITEQDTASTHNVAVVDETFVRKFFKPGEEPLGAHFGLTCPSTAAPTKSWASYAMPTILTPPATEPPICSLCRWHNVCTMTTPLMQSLDDATHFIEGAVLQVHGRMEGLEPQVRQVLSDVDPEPDLAGHPDHAGASRRQARSAARGGANDRSLRHSRADPGRSRLYGVTAYAVERRTGEIGVRMALGANRGNVIRLVLRGAFLQILIGLAIGIPVAIGCSRLIAAQLYQVKGGDPLCSEGSISAGGCAFVASIIPARRAASSIP